MVTVHSNFSKGLRAPSLRMFVQLIFLVEKSIIGNDAKDVFLNSLKILVFSLIFNNSVL